MSDTQAFTVESARLAAASDELATWVVEFLASPGSDNAPLAAELTDPPRAWLGPVQVPVGRLNRLAGPPDQPALCPLDEDDLERVDDMEESIEDGWEPPPMIVSYRDGQLVLEDGNHRAEGLRRAGEREVWAVINFEDPADRDRFSRSVDSDIGVVAES